MKKILPIILVVVLVVGGAAYKFVLSGGGPSISPAAAQAKEHKAAEKEKELRLKDRVEGSVVALDPEFLVNLDDPSLTHFAKFKIAMLVDAGTPIAAAGGHGAGGAAALHDDAEVRDIIIDTVSGFRAEELATADGRAKLKELIAEAVSEHTETIPLHVYFTDFAVQ